MADESELANLKALVERLTRENELLRENQHSHSEESSADGPITPSGNNDAEPAATESDDPPPAAASAEARTQAELLMEALRSVLENAPNDRGKRLPMKGPELFDGTHALFRL